MTTTERGPDPTIGDPGPLNLIGSKGLPLFCRCGRPLVPQERQTSVNPYDGAPVMERTLRCARLVGPFGWLFNGGHDWWHYEVKPWDGTGVWIEGGWW